MPNFAASAKPMLRCGQFSIFQDGGRHHLGFWKCGDFRGGKAQDGQNASPRQISRRSAKPLLRNGHFSIFQDGGRRRLEFWKCGNFRGEKVGDDQSPSPCQISRRSAQQLLRYGHFSIFQDGGGRGLGFWKCGNFRSEKARDGQNASPIHRAKFRGDRPNRCHFSFFQDGGRRHLGFSKCGNFGGREAEDNKNASPCQISRRSVEPLLRHDDFSIFPRWRPSAILDLCWAYLDHPRRAFGGLYHCAKFGWNRRSSFHNMHVFFYFSGSSEPSKERLVIISYNLYGFKQGFTGRHLEK